MALPAYRIDNARIDFEPLNQGINALADARNRYIEQERVKALGARLASGDMRGAESLAFEQGDLDTGLKFQTERQRSQNALAEMQRAAEKQAWDRQWKEREFNADQEYKNRSLSLEERKAAQQLAGGGNEYSLQPVYGVDDAGNPILMQMSKAGGVKAVDLPSGVKVAKSPLKVDLGTEILLIDPVTRQPISSMPKNVAGEENQKVVGRETAERQMAVPKAKASLASLEASNKIVSDTIDKALPMIDSLTAGAGGTVLNYFPGTSARDVSALVETIKGNIGFDKLQDMRDNSPTGGALGQVAVQELQALQSVLGSLDQSQSPSQLRASLGKIREILQQAQSRRRAAFEATYGGLEQPKRSFQGFTLEDVE